MDAHSPLQPYGNVVGRQRSWSRMLLPPRPETKTNVAPGVTRTESAAGHVGSTVCSCVLTSVRVREYECSCDVAMIAPSSRHASYGPQPTSSPLPPTCI